MRTDSQVYSSTIQLGPGNRPTNRIEDYTDAKLSELHDAIDHEATQEFKRFKTRVKWYNGRMAELHRWDKECADEKLRRAKVMGEEERAQVEYSYGWAAGVR